MTKEQILTAFDTHLPPDIAERAKRAYDKHRFSCGGIGDTVIKEAIDSFDWERTKEGYGFWKLVCNGDFTAARALLAPDYKEMWEAADRLIQTMTPPQGENGVDEYIEAYTHYQHLKSKHNEN